MPTFASYDGTRLSYRLAGDGRPLVCLPGGPGRASEYLGDLGGLGTSRQLVLLDPRGVGMSADPADPATFRVDRLVSDVESLRAHLGLDQMDLLAHSAGAVLATLYAAACPERLSALILVTPGLAAIGVESTEDQVRAALRRRAAEPWYPDALAGLEQILAGDAVDGRLPGVPALLLRPLGRHHPGSRDRRGRRAAYSVARAAPAESASRSIWSRPSWTRSASTSLTRRSTRKSGRVGRVGGHPDAAGIEEDQLP